MMKPLRVQIKALILLLLCVFMCEAVDIDVFGVVRGQKYAVRANRVRDFLEKIESMAGLERGQSKVLYRGKVLSASDLLSTIGVSDKESLMVVRSTQKLSKKTRTK